MSVIPTRVASGTPDGGRFATSARAEADLSLDDRPNPTRLDDLRIPRGVALGVDGHGTSEVFSGVEIGRLPSPDDDENFYAVGYVPLNFRDGLCAQMTKKQANTYLDAHAGDIGAYLNEHFDADLDGGMSWESRTAVFQAQMLPDADLQQVIEALESDTRALDLHSQVELDYRFYENLATHLADCDTRRAVAPPKVYAETTTSPFSQTIELRTAEGQLQDAPDGTPAYRHQDRSGRTLTEARFTGGVHCDGVNGEPATRAFREDGTVRQAQRRNAAGELHDLPDGTAACREYTRDGRVRLERRFQNGELADALDGTPAERTLNVDGSVYSDKTADGQWIGYDRQERVAVHIDPRNGQQVRTSGLAGDRMIVRIDSDGQLHDGPGGEPAAVALRPDGTIRTASYVEHGVLSKTVDHDGAQHADAA